MEVLVSARVAQIRKPGPITFWTARDVASYKRDRLLQFQVNTWLSRCTLTRLDSPASFCALRQLIARKQRTIRFLTKTEKKRKMSQSASLVRLTLAVVMVSIVLVMMSSTNLGAEARYLPTRSDPLLPVGPPRGEDPRFDRLYDVIKELLRNGGGGEFEDAKFEPKARPVYEGGRF